MEINVSSKGRSAYSISNFQMTTGGTESIMMACKAYRDFGREVNGITKPNIVMPRTAHSGFDKAAQYLGIYIRYVDVDPETMEADIAKMQRAINRNTIMVERGFHHSLDRSRFSKAISVFSWSARHRISHMGQWTTFQR